MGLARPIRDSRRVRVVLASSGFCPLPPPSATSNKNLKLTLAQGCDRQAPALAAFYFGGHGFGGVVLPVLLEGVY